MSTTVSKILAYYLILFFFFLKKDKSPTPPPLMFSREIYEIFRSSHRTCFMKKGILKNFAIFRGKSKTCNLIKKRPPAQMFSSGYCEIFKSSNFEEYLLTATSDFFKTVTEHLRGTDFVLTLLLSLDNLLTGYEQLKLL